MNKPQQLKSGKKFWQTSLKLAQDSGKCIINMWVNSSERKNYDR